MRVLKDLLVCVLVAGAVLPAVAQNQASPKEQQTKPPAAADALEFLGSYSAPNAIMATETGHTSAHPPSPSTDRRLRQIEAGSTILPPWPMDFLWPAKSLQAECSAAGAAEGESLVREVQQAESALNESRFGKAAAIFNEILKERSTCTLAEWNRAVARAYAGFPSALTDLLSTLSNAPEAASGHLLLGLERIAGGDADEARRELLPLLHEKAPGLPERDWVWGRAVLAWSSGAPAEARQWLSRLLVLESETPAVWFAMGGVALEEARENSRRLGELAPESIWNRKLESEALAVRYPSLAQRVMAKGATSTSGDAGTVPPASAATQANAKASSADENIPGETENPEVALQKLTAFPDSPEVFYLRARAALRLSQSAYARAALSPTYNAQLRALRALAAEQEHDEAAAIGEYRVGLAENPRSALLHAGLGHLYRARSDLELARVELSEASRLDPSDPVVAFELGDVYLRLTQPNRALELLNRALELDAGLLLARWSRGKAYLALGDTERARADLEAAAPVDTTGDLQFQLARLYQKLGRPDLAQQAQKHSEEQRKTKEGRQ
jgi:tetratricopeptide (TPR) repeat protein